MRLIGRDWNPFSQSFKAEILNLVKHWLSLAFNRFPFQMLNSFRVLLFSATLPSSFFFFLVAVVGDR
jgi:hypothetical protein